LPAVAEVLGLADRPGDAHFALGGYRPVAYTESTSPLLVDLLGENQTDIDFSGRKSLLARPSILKDTELPRSLASKSPTHQNLWHTRVMPTRSGKDHDFTTIARRVVEQAIGEHLNGTPLEEHPQGKNPKAVASGRLGGIKGGKARAEKLSFEQRHKIAQKAASVRWSSRQK
jgi:hypothetical protein